MQRVRRLGLLSAAAAVALIPTQVFLVTDHPLDKALAITLGIGCGWGTGVMLVQYLLLRDRPVEPREQEAPLARLNERFGAYPHLWPATVPIIVAVVGAVAFVVVELLKLIAS